ncbi:PglZ domain-containing protein [Variovorax sp. YR216]|uniref:PglZ domain-containing protein n=1 Tax=Variovorax sp. YR216 TaxID=1882828 RepID=UPI00089D6547|nr:PglZ domain-containing protein [Variovorax sp. YR216]SEA76215.1 PglZ domain-containing protein [Variovorax sp. YR216]
MSIAEYVREQVLRPRLVKAGCLVVYDPQQRYRDLCLALATDKLQLVDTAESSIESREAALRALQQLGRPKHQLEGALIYVPAKRPETDEDKQADPFSIFAACGAVFPQDDGDDYLSLCLRAKPDHATEIRQVFASSAGGPSFAVIDAIGGGVSWPQLRATLGVESGREILVGLLAPGPAQQDALKAKDGWVQESTEFLRATLAMSVKTRGKTWGALADELWRYVLFSEFVFDLPVALPEPLKGVPHAPPEARPVIEHVCEQLRNSPKSRDAYIERAEGIEKDLKLVELCGTIDDLGERDTFPFEERTFLRGAIKGITSGDADATRRALARHKSSVWLGKGESQAQWELVRAGLGLIEACDDFERQLPDHARSQSELLDFYLGSLREADRLQREFEQAMGDFLDPHGLMHEVSIQARARYRRLAEKVQGVFVKHIETTGWPPAGRLANADVFDKLVGSRLKDSGRKVAYLMVDALRYELGVALEKMLAEDGPVELHAAYAQLPTITIVGMASLLPGAGAGLSLALEGDTLVPKVDGMPAAGVPQRMGVIAKRYGDRFGEMPLGDFVRSKIKPADTIDLLVLRSTEIDSQLESNPESTLGLIPGTLKLIRAALHKLRGLGFKDAVIVADHGFFLNAQAEAGDVCVKPQGKWTNAHDRMMLGDGTADSHSLVMAAQKLGIRGDFKQVALPRSMAPYRKGHLYFHGGASLAEAVVPVLVARLDSGGPAERGMVKVELNYKSGAKRITTRMPVVEVALLSDDMFTQETAVEILLEAQDGKGNVVGEPRTGSDVNPATRTITLLPSQRKQIALRMDDEFRGKFTVKALNPTTLAALASLPLETDYVE